MKQDDDTCEIAICSAELQPRKLNWTKVLFDYHICLDAEAFEKWNGDMAMDGQDILEKDIPRTRCEDPHMKKQSFQEVLRRMTTFYCKQNGVTYQQGLLEVVYPFALLRRKDFKTKKCYAYFNAFMRKHFPKVLVQRVVEGKKQLPHAILAITLTECLLRFHYPYLYHCFRQQQVPMSMVVTQQLLTIFAKNLPIHFVYQIYDYFIQKNNSNYIFFMAVALIGRQQKQLIQASAKQQMHKQVQCIKKFASVQDLKEWFTLAEQIARDTPSTFKDIASEFCFSNRNLLSVQDVEKMLNSHQLVSGGHLPISIEEINQNIDRYVLVLVDRDQIDSEKQYRTLRITPNKKLGEGELDQSKVYVLATHQNNLPVQSQILLDFVSTMPHIRFLNLREHLIDEQKDKKCTIF